MAAAKGEKGQPDGRLAPATAETCPEFVRRAAEQYDDRAALALGDETLTYRQLDEQSRVLASGLLTRGVGKGHRIGLLYQNGPRWAVVWAAITRIGAVAVPLSTLLRPPELARVVRHADLHGVLSQRSFLTQDFVRNFEQAFEELTGAQQDLQLVGAPFLRWVVIDDPTPPRWARPVSWLTEAPDVAAREDIVRAAEKEVFTEEPAMIIYTSGQSAEPKGVLHSHANILGKTHLIREKLGFGPGAENIAAMPFFWVGGLIMTLFPTLEVGGLVRCSTGPTFGFPVTTSASASDLPSNRYDGYTFPANQEGVRMGLGMSETFGPYAFGTEPPHPICPPMTMFDPEAEVKVVDSDGKPVEAGQRGEMVVRGRGVTLGLHKVSRSRCFDADGFYRTGDECEVREDAIYFVRRLNDMIKTGGANVSPAEVENELLQLAGITGAHVVAIEDQKRGSVVGAAVILEAGASISTSEIQDALRGRLSSYKVPRMIAIVTREEVPLTPSNKVNRPALGTLIQERAGVGSPRGNG